MADTIGTATIKVLPDLSEFRALVDALDSPVTLVDTTTYERDQDGNVSKVTRTVYLDRAESTTRRARDFLQRQQDV